MTVTAPPRPPDRVDQDEPVDGGRDDGFDAVVAGLIEEARQRARRRRRIYGAAAALAGVLVALAGVAGFTAFGGGGQAVNAAPGPAAPLNAHGEDATLVAHYSKFHVGWVLVYADGRVITYRDAEAPVLHGGSRYVEVEQRLSPVGVELVRSGDVEPEVFLRDAARALPAAAWLDRERRTYVPTRYAVLYFGDQDDGPVTPVLGATLVVDRLPAPLRTLLHGKQQRYGRWSLLLDSARHYPSTLENSELTAAEARVLRRALKPFATRDHGNSVPLSAAIGENRGVIIDLRPIYPHGEWALWLG